MAKFKPNDDQKEFIGSTQKRVLVSASAGSGKTSTMIQKILHLLLETHTPITNFLVVTYTNAAAAEIKQKLYNAITEKIVEISSIDEKNFLKQELDNLNNAEIGTLHAICKKLIVKYFYEVGQSPDFNLLNEKESGYLYESALDKVFKNHISVDDLDFFELYDCYNAKRTDENLKSIVIKLKNFINSKTSVEDWKKQFFESSYNLDLNNNQACLLILAYYKSMFAKSRNHLNVLMEKRSLLNLDKYTIYLQNRYHFIDAFCSAQNFEQAVKIADNFVVDRKPTKNKNADVEELDFDEEVSNFATELKNKIDGFKKSIVTTDLSQIKEDLTKSKNNLIKLFNIVDEIDSEYSRLKTLKNSLDFNDLEDIMQEILNNKEIKEVLANNYKYVFVDEYQDINEKQENILNQFLKDNEYFMIGDVKQSIYAFRQSSPKIFISKYADYSQDGVENRVINFNVNYRSEKNILEFANFVFDNLITIDTIGIDYKSDARFVSEKDLTVNNVTFKIVDSKEEQEDKEQAEALIIADTIVQLLKMKKVDGTPFEYRDIAIILRSRGSYVKTLCDTLIGLKIPVTAQVRNDFFNTMEIQVMINLLKCVSNFKNDIALVSVLKNLFDFNENELLCIRNSSEEKYFYDKVIKYDNQDSIKDRLNLFFEFISNCHKKLTFKTIYELLTEILDDYNLLLKIKSLPNGLERADNILSFLNIADNDNYKYSLDKFLEYLDFASKDNTLQTIGVPGNAVQICTIHHSKGLEYPAVILAGMGKKFQTNKESSEIIINTNLGVGLKSINSKDRLLTETILRNACKIDNIKNELNEEIRLLYVAMTRAREKLYMIGTTNIQEVVGLHRKDIYSCGCYLDMIFKSLNHLDAISFANKSQFVINEGLPCESNVEIISVKDIGHKEDKEIPELILNAVDEKLLNTLKSVKKNKVSTETFTIKNTVTNILTEEKDYENLNFEPSKLDVTDKIENTDVLKLGTAYHLVMQHINFNESYEDIVELIERLKSAGMIDTEIAKLINVDSIVGAVNNLKPYILKANKIYKEKQFLLQENYNKLVKNSDNNTRVIVQGVIDTVLVFDNEAYLIDYKTNKTNNEQFLIDRYGLQLNIYQIAFEKATNIKITKKFLYSFYLNKLIELK